MGRDAGCGEQTDSIDPLLYVQGRWDDGGQGDIFAPPPTLCVEIGLYADIF